MACYMHRLRHFLSRISCITLLFFAYSTSYAESWEKETISQLDTILVNLSSANPWPMFDISKYPIIVTFENQHNYAFHFSPHNPHWVKRSNQPLSYYLDHDEYDIDHLAWAFGNHIDDQLAFIFNLDQMKEDFSLDALHVLLHERFHIFQFEEFPAALFAWKKYEGFNHLESIKLTTVEDAALFRYIQSHNREDLKNYVAISSYRQTLNDHDSLVYETSKEDIEGTADYYSWQAVIKDPEARAKAIIHNYQNKCSEEHTIKCQLQDRYYFTGNASGIALDELDSHWKEKLLVGRQSVRTQLFQQFPMTDAEVSQRIAVSKKLYHYDEISKPIEDAVKLYQSQREAAVTSWNNMDGIVLKIATRPCNLFGIIYMAKNYYLDSDTQLVLGSNGPSQCADESIAVNYSNTPFLWQTEHNGEIQVKIPQESIIQLDHAVLSAADLINGNKNYHFKDFYVKTPTIEIKVKNRAGELRIVNGNMELITATT